MTSRHSGTIRGSGPGASRSYNSVRSNYALPGDEERERAAQPSPWEIGAALVAEFERLQARRGQ